MAVSGSKNFAITRSDIIGAALRKIGIFDEADAVSGEATTTANIALNLMIKEYVNEGLDLFLRTESTLFLQPNTQKYALSTANITDSYLETTFSSAIASGLASFPTTDDMLTAGTSVGDFAGVKQDDNTILWGLVTAVGTGSFTTDTNTTDTCASGNKIYTYTTKSDVPQKLLYAFRSDINAFDTEIAIIGENEYRRQSNKTSNGPPVEIWYNRKGNTSTGELFVWPDNGGKNWDKIVLIANHLPDDFDSSGDNPDFPIEFGNVLVWGLAAELAAEYGIPEREQGRLWSIAQHKLDNALDYSVEDASVIFALANDR